MIKIMLGRKVLRFIGFYHIAGKTFMMLLTKVKTTFCVYFGTQNGTYKIIVGKSAVCRKSAKTAKDFSNVAFIILTVYMAATI